jgi:hypothetical protein
VGKVEAPGLVRPLELAAGLALHHHLAPPRLLVAES